MRDSILTIVVMVSEQNPPNDQTTDDTKPASAPLEEGLLSVEEMDRLISEEDAEFGSVVESIHAGSPSADTRIELLDLDALLEEENAKSLKARIRRLNKRLYAYYMSFTASAVYFVTTRIPQFAKLVLGRLSALAATIKEALRQFGFKPLRYKLTVFGFIFLCAVSGVFSFWLFKHGIPEDPPLFAHSMAEFAVSTETYDPSKDLEPFYESVRAAQNVFNLKKLVVNLSRTSRSGSNPMAACEVILEGNSPDVVIEVKARENEFRDAFMRVMEEFTYEQLEAAAGKQKLLETLLREANRLVTRGQVRKIYFKNIILKP